MSVVVVSPQKVASHSRPFRSDGGPIHRLRPLEELGGVDDGILAVPPVSIVSSTARPPADVPWRQTAKNNGGADLLPSATTMAPPLSSVSSAGGTISSTAAEGADASAEGEETADDRHNKKAAKTPLRPGNGLSISAVWEGVKRMMGFTADCHNGGYKTIGGDCICPQFFEGKSCERIVCAHNGTRVRVAAFGGDEVCKCAHPQYISGKHCEVVHCQNGGRLLNDGTCHCVDGWYTGQFCQFYTSSWLIAFGVPLLVIAAIVFCCVICRLDLCALRRASPPSTGRHNRRPNGRRNGHQNGQPSTGGTRRCRSGGANVGNRHRREQVPFRVPSAADSAELAQQFHIQQNLLNGRHHHTQQQYQQHQYVLRLEHIPVYNPRLFTSDEQSKPLEPPPPYEQAIRCPPRQQQRQDNNCPPIYSALQLDDATNDPNGTATTNVGERDNAAATVGDESGQNNALADGECQQRRERMDANDGGDTNG